MKGILCDYKFF